MINFLRGNLFNDLGQADCAVNTINCNGVMGKGVALEFKKLFPDMFGWYRQLCHEQKIRPGDVFPYVAGPLPYQLTIFNMATKGNWWEPSQYEWIDVALENLHDYLRELYNYADSVVLLPPPGCGNGGLSWETVRPMVKRHLKDLSCEVRVYEPN